MRNIIMNKKFILLGLCLVLTSQIGFAKCQVSQSNNAQSVTNSKSSENCSKVDYPKEAVRYKNLIRELEMDSATVYNALNLTDEQVKLRESLVKEYSPYYDEKLDELLKESFRLKALECGSASRSDINRSKKNIKNIKKDIEKCIKKENKEFYKSLTSLQKSKYKLIKELEERDYKEEEHRKDYYKSNPQMVPFGNPARTPVPIGRD